MLNRHVRCNATDADVVLRRTNRARYVRAMPGRGIPSPVTLVVWIHVTSVAIACGGTVLNHVNAPTLGHVRDQIGMVCLPGINNGDDDACACCVVPRWGNIRRTLFPCCGYVHIPLGRIERIDRINQWKCANVRDDANDTRCLLPRGECRLCILARSEFDLARLSVVAHRRADTGVVGEANGE